MYRRRERVNETSQGKPTLNVEIENGDSEVGLIELINLLID